MDKCFFSIEIFSCFYQCTVRFSFTLKLNTNKTIYKHVNVLDTFLTLLHVVGLFKHFFFSYLIQLNYINNKTIPFLLAIHEQHERHFFINVIMMMLSP